ncbi:hypothetical protein ED733_000890 [Metarhizium rileyi]|uniref:GTP cyclohydrolase 1 n=1 Tax=Metarhizium rileyi (strain RCEF 4871) TaxID=1649241 RepID=A0A5C6G0Y6_METRR|nr:hypothetical protein ED733_000890 [Metarhizium rileyi]
MPQSEATDGRDTPSCSSVSASGSDGGKRRKSKNGERSKKRRRDDDDDSSSKNSTKLAKASRGDGLRRSSISKPGRDRRDEPTIRREKRERREKRRRAAEDDDGEAKRDASRDASRDARRDAQRDASQSRSMARLDSPVIDFDGLSRPSIGARARLEERPDEAVARLDRLKGAVRTIIECVGENADREGLLATPQRYAKAMLDFTKGYEQNVLDIVNGAIFQEGHSEMVIVKDIDIYSVCEHHLVPFTGKMHIGYIPNNAVIGISKLPRIAEMFARRLQIQERLTKEVANAIFEVLRPQGVAVVMESSHLCMVMRGVQKTTSTTMTSCMLGCFERRSKTRNEFLSLINVNAR